MDQIRKIRFLYPPFMVFISLMIGLYFDYHHSINGLIIQFKLTDSTSELILALLTGGILMLVLGFIIEMITTVILKLFFRLFKRPHYAAASNLTPNTYDKIKEKIFYNQEEIILPQQYLYSAVTFDSAVVPEKIHDWIVRRWNSFNVSSNSIFAFVISIIPMLILDIKFSVGWILVDIIIVFFLVINASNAWKETKRMLEFHAHCNQEKLNQYK
ncbi:MAG: hypothetical protein HC905_29295 [Bacteroidales bacterium]|nr:hypothetical protein [Bacteroidales bacterium]